MGEGVSLQLKYLKEDGCCVYVLCLLYSYVVTRSVNWSSAVAVVVVVCDGGSLAVKRSTSPLPLVVTALLLVMLAGLIVVAIVAVVGAISGKLLPVISVLSCALALSRNRSRLASERSLLDS